MQWKKAKENHLPRLLRCFADTFNNKHYTSKEKEKKGGKKPRLTKKSLWRRDENTWNSTNFPNNHTQMGIPPIRIDYPLPHPQSLPHHPRGAYLGAREPSQRALSNRISSQPKVIRHPRRGGGWGWSPGKRGKGGGHRAGSEKREQRERETERRNKGQKDREGGSERNAGRDESRQRIRLNFFACDVRPLLFSTLPSARNSIFVSARVYIRFSDNLPRQWEDTLHRAPPVYIPIAAVYPPISAGADENELSSFEPSSFTDPAPNSNGRARRLPLRARRQRRRTKTRLRVIRWCVYRASVGRGVTG